MTCLSLIFIIYSFYFIFSDFERRAIIATGEVQAQLGCPVSFHPGRHPEAPFEIIRLYQEAGGDVSKAVMSHLDSKLKNHILKLFYAYTLPRLRPNSLLKLWKCWESNLLPHDQ